ncbi:MAG: DUF87 domain-containing protein [archaeon GB-1867-035]|nr:DUF87 domain-containing protein [Candidatus Culexmicrobium profundum]
MEKNILFDDLNGKFRARLRQTQIKTRSYEEGRIILKSIIGIFEAAFDLEVLDRLKKPCFLALKRPTINGEVYLIYEVVSARPIHYQELSMDVSMPKVLRGEFLKGIYEMWGKSEDTWIDIQAIYTGYVMKINDENVIFEHDETCMPLVGAEAYLLSRRAVDMLINIEEGTCLGEMIGFEHYLKIDVLKLIKYHGGVFGFTGTGKSNLTSLIIRKVLEKLDDTRVVIIDIAGEYGISLIDKILEYGMILTTENYGLAEDKIEAFLASQAIPETLLERLDTEFLSKNLMRELLEKIFDINRVKIIDLSKKISLTIGDLLSSFEDLMRDDRPSVRLRATRIYSGMRELLKGLNLTLTIKQLKRRYGEIYNKLDSLLAAHQAELNQIKYPPRQLLNTINEILEIFGETTVEKEGREDEIYTPEKIAYELIRPINGNKIKLFVCYLPDPLNARQFVSRLIDELFALRKRSIRGARVLVVLDEAQEFIPDRIRRDDFSAQSNLAVERLLRQGRKYRIHGWISTQRVAHLNVNAIQQLHSYFAGTLPRSYDRRVIAEASGVSPEILDKTALLDIGEWLFVSHKATKRKNIPVFIKALNNEDILIHEITKNVNLHYY